MNELEVYLEPTETVEATPPELSIVMPCLNEAETIAACVRKAQTFLEANSIVGEVVVADNGSTDGSQQIARRLGARIVDVTEKGYGSALRGGINAARGKYVIMGDADDSYDFSSLGPFVESLRQGTDLVMGNRFRGGILPGAMPWKHKWIGNPVLSSVGRLFFQCPVGDFHCGMRGFTKAAFAQLDLQTTGMEFASEMVIKSALLKLKVVEVPTILHKDGRSHPPHLRSWRDGWRHLRFMLLFSPRWLFLYPGALTFLLGWAMFARLWYGPLHVGKVILDINTMLVSGFICLLGYQLVVFAVFTKLFVVHERLHPRTRLSHVPREFNLEMGVVAGLVLFLAGLGLLISALFDWREVRFGALDPEIAMREVIPAVVLMTLGAQTIFASFFLGVLTLKRKRP
jgi:glycosyltransferase involved in cell wall biosynthesis